MTAYVLKRLMAIVPTCCAVAVIVFAILRLTPGDPAAMIAGDMATPDQLAQIRAALGIDQPLYLQFILWAERLLHGDLGTSLISQVPVTRLIADRSGPTMALASSTIVLSVIVAVPLGVAAAHFRDSWLDRSLMGFSVLGFSVPVFLKGYLLVLVFAVGLHWLPVQGYASPADGVVGFATRLVLPTVALSLSYIALIARITRSSVLEVIREDYVRTARAKGLGERMVLFRHALRNAAVPVLTVIGIGIATLIGGVVVTESVFNLPGLGRLVVESVLARDYPVVQGLILVFALVCILINLAIDLFYCVFDPRVSY